MFHVRRGAMQLPIQIFSQRHNFFYKHIRRSRFFTHFWQTLASAPYIVTLLRTDFNPISPTVCERLAAQRSHWVHRARRALRRKTPYWSCKTYMQIATMTTFPGPCINVVLLPDRGYREKKNRTRQHIFKVIQWLEGLHQNFKSTLFDMI